jgi:phosphoadenosine phosphosulfate reductase
MRITMVKKRLADGRPCAKCIQAEALLRARQRWSHIDEVLWVAEGEPPLPDAILAAAQGIATAPFFVVTGEDGAPTVYTSVLALLREVLDEPEEARDGTEVAPADAEELAEAGAALERREPEEILRWGLDRFGGELTVAFSGAEDVVLIAMAARLGGSFRVFSLDTGRLHPETYRFLDQVRKRYRVEIEAVFPDLVAVEALVRKKGFFSFYDDGHGECCRVRKVEPLRRRLGQSLAWVTGLRRDQSPVTRGRLSVLEVDPVFRGRNDAPLAKLCPLLDWSSDQVWAYVREHDVPYNELHTRGFRSIGCEPCTRATLPGEHERAGRWWWEDATLRECGLHVVKPPPAPPAIGL